MKPSSFSVLAFALTSTVLTALPASAQELQRGETVIERPRPEVEQLGVRAGGFLLLPRVEAGLTYDSNVFATDTDTRDDMALIVRPQLNVRSDFNNHALNFSVGGETARYFDYSSENYTDYNITAGGRFDYSREGSVSAGLVHRREHEGRSDPDFDPTFIGTGSRAEPITYTVSGGDLAVTQAFNRFSTRLGASANYFDYADVELNGLGGKSNQDYRNRWEYNSSLRVGYEVMQGLQGFVRGGYTWQRYASSTYNRDSDGYEIVGGVSSDLGGLFTGEVYAGYLTRDYDDPALKDFSGLTYGGKLTWNVTQLTTLTGAIDRQVRESTYLTASSYNRTVFALAADHELLRTLLLNARLQYREDDFNGFDRSDKVYTAGGGASYQFSRYLYLTGGYTYETRNSTVNGFDYDDHLVYLRLGAQM